MRYLVVFVVVLFLFAIVNDLFNEYRFDFIGWVAVAALLLFLRWFLRGRDNVLTDRREE